MLSTKRCQVPWWGLIELNLPNRSKSKLEDISRLIHSNCAPKARGNFFFKFARRRPGEFFLNCAPKVRGKFFFTRLPTGFSILAFFGRGFPTGFSILAILAGKLPTADRNCPGFKTLLENRRLYRQSHRLLDHILASCQTTLGK